MFIIHITKIHLFSFMRSFLVLIASFGLTFNINAAEKSLGPEDMPQVFKSGDASAGSSLVDSCVACHGTDGNSMNSDWPKLAGQNEKYLYEQLKYFKSGERNNVLMMTVTPYLQSLNDKDFPSSPAPLSLVLFSNSSIGTTDKAIARASLSSNFIIVSKPMCNLPRNSLCCCCCC